MITLLEFDRIESRFCARQAMVYVPVNGNEILNVLPVELNVLLPSRYHMNNVGTAPRRRQGRRQKKVNVEWLHTRRIDDGCKREHDVDIA